MRVRSGRSNRVAAILLLPAFLATAPYVQRCPLPLAQIDSAAFIRCLILGSAMPAPVANETPPSAGCAASNEACADAVRQACSAAGAGCSATSCPLMHPDAPSAPRPLALCVGDPLGGYGLRSAAQHVPAPDLHAVAVLVTVVDVPRPMPAWSARPALRARPPTRVPDARPPVRGPPLEA